MHIVRLFALTVFARGLAFGSDSASAASADIDPGVLRAALFDPGAALGGLDVAIDIVSETARVVRLTPRGPVHATVLEALARHPGARGSRIGRA